METVRKTRLVKAVLDKFETTDKAISASELTEWFQGDMNKTTVYRILDRLERSGTLHSFTGKDGLRWYAARSSNAAEVMKHMHYHFQCRACGSIECLNISVEVPSLPEYAIDAAELLLIGQCPECK